MAEWYLATYQNGVFINKLGFIQPDGDYVYELKNGIQSGESPVKSDWLRITILDNKVEKWDGSSWTEDTNLTGLVNNSTCWVYGSPYVYYTIITNSQVYYLESFTHNETNIIGNSDVTIDKTAIKRVIIGSSVTSINEGAFVGCTNLAELTIGNSVTSIGDSAFYQCSSLASVNIPDSVQIIGNAAFDGCTGLASLTIGDSVTTIGDYAFRDCTSLASVKIPDSVTIIGEGAFWECTGLASVDMGNSVERIGYDAFYYCIILVSVNIPNSVTTIDNGAFSQCKSLESVTIGNSVTSIGESAFYNINLNNNPTEASITIPLTVLTAVAPTLTYGTNKSFFSSPNRVTLINPDA
tara:strand:+ start:12 stop:1067 length:1056 start_codon:yes stop_codon:yes gene_type:complete